MNIRTQMTFFDRKNPITIRRQFDNDDFHRPMALDKKYKNNVQINFHNISSKALDIPDIFSHSIEKHKNNNISSYSKISKVKQNKSQEKIVNNKIANKRDIFNFPVNNNFSLSNINYYPNKRNKNTLTNSISLNENNNHYNDILKNIKKNYQIKSININKNRNKNNNISTSLPKIKIKKNPLSNDIEKEKEKENGIIKITKKEKEKRSTSQLNNIYSVNNTKSKMIIKINQNNYKQISLEDILNDPYSFYQPAKHSENSFDKIISYGVNTYKGTIRQYNEDRVTILINASINKNNNINNIQKISLFSIYDGHAGNKCCEYLKSYLHHYIFDSEFFPQNPIKAIEQGFKNCENNFLNSIMTSKNQIIDSSGSCAIIILIINDSCYIANLGDSRALYSFDDGKKFFQLSRDHKPNDPIEKKRIYKAGGKIYKSNIQQISENSLIGFKTNKESLASLPYRIFPGRLSVSYFLIL
jgi:serine/threonine protein phosphatase PrpC